MCTPQVEKTIEKLEKEVHELRRQYDKLMQVRSVQPALHPAQPMQWLTMQPCMSPQSPPHTEGAPA